VTKFTPRIFKLLINEDRGKGYGRKEVEKGMGVRVVKLSLKGSPSE
jgi:hypothetical protein